jgi:VanZ family protein
MLSILLQEKQMLNKHFIRWKLPAILWGATILTLTSYPKLEIPDIGFNAIDKVAHLGVYFIFGFLIIRALAEGRAQTLRDYIKTSLFGICFALFDELHQLFIPGRCCEAWDAVADIIGIFLGLVIFYFIMVLRIDKSILRTE